MATPANTIENLVHQMSWHLTPDCLAQDESGTQKAQPRAQQPADSVLITLMLLKLDVRFLEMINLIENFSQCLGIGGSEEYSVPDSGDLSAGVLFERHIFLRVIGISKAVGVRERNQSVGSCPD